MQFLKNFEASASEFLVNFEKVFRLFIVVIGNNNKKQNNNYTSEKELRKDYKDYSSRFEMFFVKKYEKSLLRVRQLV